MCDFKSECATTLCHAEAGAMNLLRPTPDRLTKHLLPRHTVQAADELA